MLSHFQVYHLKEELLADQSKLMVVALHCPRKIYRKARSLGVSHCCHMAEVIEEVKAELAEIEIQSISLEQQASSTKGRKRKTFDQSNDKDTEGQITLPMLLFFIPHLRLTLPCLAKKKKKKTKKQKHLNPHTFSQMLLPIPPSLMSFYL